MATDRQPGSRIRQRTRKRFRPTRSSLAPTMFAIALAACLSGKGSDTADEGASHLESTSGSTGEIAATCTLPPGGVVDTQPQSAWTEGSFSVTDDGAATYHLPLWVPDGRGGLAPQLALNYNSRAGNGPIGVGWSLSGISSITPCAQTMAQDGKIEAPTFEASDVYCLGGQRLRSEEGPPGPHREYRTERETFARIISYHQPLPGGAFGVPFRFQVWTKEGLMMTYGGSDDALLKSYRVVGSTPEDPAFVRSPTRSTISAWALSRIEDRNGNAIVVEYEQGPGTAGTMWAEEMLPSRITYGPGRVVQFSYENPEEPVRPDLVDSFRAGGIAGGVHLQFRRRLHTVSVSDDTGLLRRYRLTYANTSTTGRSLLTKVEECESEGICLDSLEFVWTQGSNEFEEEEIDTGIADVGTRPLSGYTFTTGDVNGDGADDLIYGDQNNVWKFRLSNKTTGFGPAQLAGIPTIDRFHRSGFRPVDYDLDGRLDLLVEVPAGNVSKFALYRSNGTSYQLSTTLEGTAVGTDQGQIPTAYFADIDGNGFPDYLAGRLDSEANQRWRYRLGTPTGFASLVESDVVTPFSQDPQFRVRVADFDGDGRAALLAWDQPSNVYRGIEHDASTDGLGFLFASFLNLPFIREPENADRRSLHLADINCDGLPDAIYPYKGLSAQLNSGGGFSPLIPGPGPSSYTNPKMPLAAEPAVRIVDFNNDGCDDVLLFHEGPSSPLDHAHGLHLYTWRNGKFVWVPLDRAVQASVTPDQIQLLDFNADGITDIAYVAPGNPDTLRILKRRGPLPDQLIRVRVSNLGDRAEVDYTTLSDTAVHFHSECAGLGPVICKGRGGSIVAKHRLTNGLDEPSSPWHEFEHRYVNAKVDTSGHGWLGFERHTVIDTENGAETDFFFENASVRYFGTTMVYPLAGVPTRIEHKILTNGSDRYERRMDRHYDVEAGQVPGTYVLELDSIEDHDDELLSGQTWTRLHTRSTQVEHDDYGNPTRITVTQPGTVRVDVVEYDNDPTTWLIGKAKSKTETSCTTDDDNCQYRRTEFDYDAAGNLDELIVEPTNADDFLHTTLGRDNAGNVTSVVLSDAEGETRGVSIEYDPMGLYPMSVTNELGHVSSMAVHSGLGVTLRRTDPNGVCSTMSYDGFGRLREIRYADGYFERFATFGPLAQLVAIPDSTGQPFVAQTRILDKLGREREQHIIAFNDEMSTIRTRYDRRGRVGSRSRPYFVGDAANETIYAYDARDRLTKIVEPDEISNVITRYEYIGLETHTYDGKGIHSFVVEDQDGRISSRFEDDPRSSSWLVTRFRFGPFGLLTKTIAPDGTAQSITYDRRGRRIEHADPSAGTATFHYNAFNQLVREINGADEVTEFEYDLLGRVRTISAPEGQSTLVWDTAANGIGELAQSTSADGIVTRYLYDEHGHNSGLSWVVEGRTYSFDQTYDDIGRLVQLAYPALSDPTDRVRVDYVYTNSGYLSEVRDATTGAFYWRAEDRNAAGQLERETLGNNVEGTRTYSVAGLVKTIETYRSGVGVLKSIGYEYDKNRNVIRRSDFFSQGPRHQNFDYDELNRLKTWQLSSGVTREFTFNSIGNILSEIRSDAPGSPIIYRYGESGAPKHALTSRGGANYTYDAAGRQITGFGRTVRYNRFNLPTELTTSDGRTIEFSYSTDGTRVLKRDADETVISLAGLFERRISSVFRNVHYIVADGRLVAQVTRTQPNADAPSSTPEVRYIHTDAQRNVIQTTRPNGQIEDEFFYDPFGRRTNRNYAPAANERREIRAGYTSHDHDDELGLVNMRGRIYDPLARTFLTPDPLVSAPLLSQNYNRYSYVLNNPATLVDPSGFFPGPDDPVIEDEAEGGSPPGTGGNGSRGDYSGDVYTPFHPWAVSGVNGTVTDSDPPSGGVPGSGAPSSDDDNGTDTGSPGAAGERSENWVTPDGSGPWGNGCVYSDCGDVWVFQNPFELAECGYSGCREGSAALEKSVLFAQFCSKGPSHCDMVVYLYAQQDEIIDTLTLSSLGFPSRGRLGRVSKVRGPVFGNLRDHARRHALPHQSANDYYNAAVAHSQRGTPFRFRHNGTQKVAHVTRTGPDSFTFTSASARGGRIFTHLYDISEQYLRNIGITLPVGF